MVSNFNIINLFRVGMTPSGNQPDMQLSKQDMAQVRRYCTLKKTELEDENIQPMIERENAFHDSFQSELAPQREARIEEHKDRTQRKSQMQNDLMEQEDQRQRKMQERRDQEFAAKLKKEQMEQLARERAMQEEKERQDSLATRLLNFYPRMEFNQARKLLGEVNWDISAAINKYMDSQRISITFMDHATNRVFGHETFNKTEDAMRMISYLTMK